jgi:hypothetical protein
LAGFCAAAVLALSMSLGAFAAESPSAEGIVISGKTSDANGNAVQVTLQEVTDATAKAKLDDADYLKQIVGDEYVEGMKVADMKDVSVPEGTPMPVTIEFEVNGVNKNTKVVVLHYNGTEWEKVKVDAVDYRSVTATFDSLSPVAFILDKVDTTASVGSTSPKTGMSPLVLMAAFGAVVCVAGAVVLTKKERA